MKKLLVTMFLLPFSLFGQFISDPTPPSVFDNDRADSFTTYIMNSPRSVMDQVVDLSVSELLTEIQKYVQNDDKLKALPCIEMVKYRLRDRKEKEILDILEQFSFVQAEGYMKAFEKTKERKFLEKAFEAYSLFIESEEGNPSITKTEAKLAAQERNKISAMRLPRAPSPAPVVHPLPSPTPSAPESPSSTAAASRELAKRHYFGFGVALDYAAARSNFVIAANGGDAEAARYLGIIYLRGKAVAKDRVEAAKWLRMATVGGDVMAKRYLELLKQLPRESYADTLAKDPEEVDMNDEQVMKALLANAVSPNRLTKTGDGKFSLNGSLYTGWYGTFDLGFGYLKNGKGILFTKKTDGRVRQQRKKVGGEFCWTCYKRPYTGRKSNEHFYDEDDKMLRGKSWSPDGALVSEIFRGYGTRTIFIGDVPAEQKFVNGEAVSNNLMVAAKTAGERMGGKISDSIPGERPPSSKRTGTAFTIRDLALEMLWVKPGTFTMGSPSSELHYEDETQHTVTLTQGFYLGKHEVTQAQWERVMGSNPSHFKGADRPVETASWTDVTSFCNKLTALERAAGRLPAGMAYQLPTEAQWEYACRAGTKTAFSFGDSLTSDQANIRGGLGETTDVGKYPVNAWGFHDMHGNVFEFCADWRANYPSGAVRDPVGLADDRGRRVAVPGFEHIDISERVHRGGSWRHAAGLARSGSRSSALPSISLGFMGFRLSLRPASK
jgi:formylglycine-generating enzyme